MAVIRTGETHISNGGGEYLAAIGLLCGIMCSIMGLKFKGFSANLDFSKKSRNSLEPETPTVVSEGVYRQYRNEHYENKSASPIVHKPVNPSMVKLPSSPSAQATGGNHSATNKLNTPEVPPPLPSSAPPPFHSLPSLNILDSTSGYYQPTSKGPAPHTTTSQTSVTQNPKIPPLPSPVSFNPKGDSVSRMKSTDLKIQKKADPKQSKKQEKEKEKLEKQRIKEQRKKDKEFIALTLKEDAERIAREAELRKEESKHKVDLKSDKTKPKNDKKPEKKEENKSNKTPQKKAVNPLGLASAPATLTDTLGSSFSSDSAPPPYTMNERAKMEVTPSETDSSGNTSFSKPVHNMGGTWDMVTQHRQQMRRPVNEQAPSKVDNVQDSVGDRGAATIQIGQPRKSLYV